MDNFLKRDNTQRTLKTVTPSVSSIQIKNPAGSKGKNPLISDNLISFLNYRIQQEEASSRLYLSMSLWLNNNGFPYAAKLWHKYSQEELVHADWAREYLLSLGVQPGTATLESPGDTYSGLVDIIHKSFDHEIVVTTECKQLADQAWKEMDHMLYQLTQQYLKEQVEEHDKMQNHIDQLAAFGEDKIALRLLDNYFEDLLD